MVVARFAPSCVIVCSPVACMAHAAAAQDDACTLLAVAVCPTARKDQGRAQLL
jgi:hypothetical protein